MRQAKAGDLMIDWNRVDELRNDFGEDDFMEIVGLFLAEVQGKLDDMAQSAGPVRVDDFHFLKGSAANLGFRGLQAACAAAENGTHPTSTDEIDALFKKSKEAFLKQMDSPSSDA